MTRNNPPILLHKKLIYTELLTNKHKNGTLIILEGVLLTLGTSRGPLGPKWHMRWGAIWYANNLTPLGF